MILKMTEEIWEETRLFNIRLRKRRPGNGGLNNFWWPCWWGMLPEIRREYVEWVSYLVENDLPTFSAEERHRQSVKNRIENGWTPGDERSDLRKEDPYLTELSMCPGWFQEWCYDRDKIMIGIVKCNL